MDGFSYISTGSWALVRFISGEELPVIKALRKLAKNLNVIMINVKIV